LALSSVLLKTALAAASLLPLPLLLLPAVMGTTSCACCIDIDTEWGLSRAAASRSRRGVAGANAWCSTSTLTWQASSRASGGVVG
jgi:hypothetical protein